MLCFEGWIDVASIVLSRNWSKYQWSIPCKSYICALISKSPLGNTEKDVLESKEQ